jgi:hypothetical protein
MDLIWINSKETWKTSLFSQASLQPTATGAPWAKPSLPGPQPGLWSAHANGNAQHARRAVTTRGRGQGGTMVSSSRENDHRVMAYTRLHKNPEGEAGKVWLTGAVVLVRRAATTRRHRRSCRGDRRSGLGGAPCLCGTRGGVREQPEEATTGGVLTKEDNGGGTPVGWLC